MLKNFFVLSAFSFLLTLALSDKAEACVCVDYYHPMLVDYARADSVFIGKVVSVTDIPKKTRKEQDIWSDIWVTFSIERSYKGIAASTKLITLNGDYKGTNCGYHASGMGKPKTGQRWAVFGGRVAGTPQLMLNAQCDRSSPIKSERELAVYEEQLLKGDSVPGIAVGLVISQKFGSSNDVEVSVERDGIRQIAKDDKYGFYNFPSLTPGKYTISLILAPGYTFSYSSEQPVRTTYSAELKRNILSYEVELKHGDYAYNEIQLYPETKKPN